MKIVIYGAGAIGSLFGAFLSRNNHVVLIGRSAHIQAIKQQGLHITGRTHMTVRIAATTSVDKVMIHPDVVILTVKSFDTETSIRDAQSIIRDDTLVLTLQNGLDNVDKISSVVNRENIVAGVTTHGVLFSAPGCITHTGKGHTVLGELNGRKTQRIKHLTSVFNKAGINTTISMDIWEEIWGKAIINSSINPLTTFFRIPNGYLLENPILDKLVEKLCTESTQVAKRKGVYFSNKQMYEKTREVITQTAENYSSMLQSFIRRRKTEIDSINGKIVETGRKLRVETPINDLMVRLVKSLCEE